MSERDRLKILDYFDCLGDTEEEKQLRIRWVREMKAENAELRAKLTAPPPTDGGLREAEEQLKRGLLLVALLRNAMKLLDVAGMWKAPVDEQWRMSYADLRKRYDSALARPAQTQGEPLTRAERRAADETISDDEYELRKFIALAHQDGKCHIYGDDGELQCNDMARHGRTIDFRREPIPALLEAIYTTRLREYAESQKAVKD